MNDKPLVVPLERSSARFRLITTAVISVILLLGILFYFRGGKFNATGLGWADEVKVEFPSPGTTLVRVNGRPDKASFLLAASDLWVNTGLSIAPGDSIRVTASGKAHLAVHHLVEDAQLDVEQQHGWMGPGGRPAGSSQVSSAYRQNLKIMPNAQDGILLACLYESGTPEPSQENPRPKEIYVVGADLVVKNNSSSPRTLWFVLNDAVLSTDEESRRAYLEIDDDAKSEEAQHARPAGFDHYDPADPKSWSPYERWRYVKQHQYWNLWFDDNVGFYHVQIDFQGVE